MTSESDPEAHASAFRGKVAIVTGSTEGIGRATAQLLLRRGACLILNGRDPHRLDVACRALSEDHLPVQGVAGDAADPETARKLADLATKTFGHIDILVNNAGGSTHARAITALDPAMWEQTVAANLFSVFQVCAAVVPAMQAQRSGSIVNVASLAGRQRSVVASSDYASAKAGLIGFTRQLAHELAPCGIRVNAVAPGLILTPRVEARWHQRSPAERERYLATVPLGRPGRPADVAEAIAFLASEAASYITGATIDVNGGSFMP